jgi:hypothetical protein
MAKRPKGEVEKHLSAGLPFGIGDGFVDFAENKGINNWKFYEIKPISMQNKDNGQGQLIRYIQLAKRNKLNASQGTDLLPKLNGIRMTNLPMTVTIDGALIDCLADIRLITFTDSNKKGMIYYELSNIRLPDYAFDKGIESAKVMAAGLIIGTIIIIGGDPTAIDLIPAY